MRQSLSFRSALLALALAPLALAGCGAATPTPETVEAQQVNVLPVVSATGEVLPADWADLSFATGGDIAEILVERGQQVEAGDVLARLEDSTLRAVVAEAEAALAQAEANLALVEAGPTEEEIRAAEGALSAAYASTAAAQARKNALYEIDEDARLAAERQLIEAQNLLQQLNANAGVLQSIDVSGLTPDETHPWAQLEPLSYQIDLAQTNLQAAQAALSDLLDGPNPSQVAVQDAQIGLANAQAAAAQARLDYLKAQPFPEQIAVAEAQVEQARAGLLSAQARLDQAVLKAPFDGMITAIYLDANEFIGPGQRAIQIGDLASLRVETTDLNEIDVARVQVGDSAIVTFDALPGVEVSGTVARIAPKSSQGTGVNYTVIIDLAEIPEQVRWGMTAFVDIEVGD